MDITRIHEMLENLTECAKEQFNNGISSIDTCEMGKVVDMIKDLAEAEYHALIAKSMKEYEEDEVRRFYDHYRYADGRFAPKGDGTYRRTYMPYLTKYDGNDIMSRVRMRDLDRNDGRMYYTEPISHDMNESRYDKARRMYTESKELHKANTQNDKDQKMKDLENYFKEISEDLTDVISDATAEEKAMLRTKLTGLAGRI